MEPAAKATIGLRIREIVEAKYGSDLGGVIPPLPPRLIGMEALNIRDAELAP